MIESKNQRLILFNKHFIDILATVETSPLHFQSHIKSFRKILGKDFAKPLISYYQKVMGREYTDQEFNEIMAEITNYLAAA
jgi:tRNA(Ser,Leu) C12 N-acetylase TAN1